MLISDFVKKTEEIAGFKSHSELARAVGVTQQAVSLWARDMRYPDATAAARMAVLQGREPLAGVAAVELERNKDDADAVRFWRTELKKVREFIFRFAYISALFACSSCVARLQQSQRPQR